MNKFKLQQIGVSSLWNMFTIFDGIFSDYVCITFFGEPEFPSDEN